MSRDSMCALVWDWEKSIRLYFEAFSKMTIGISFVQLNIGLKWKVFQKIQVFNLTCLHFFVSDRFKTLHLKWIFKWFKISRKNWKKNILEKLNWILISLDTWGHSRRVVWRWCDADVMSDDVTVMTRQR